MTAAEAAAEPPMGQDDWGIGPGGTAHVAVLEGLVVEWLRPRPGTRIVDGTIGLGGHAAALLAVAPDTVLVGLDRDPDALSRAAERLRPFGDRVHLHHASFADLGDVLASEGWDAADAVLLDLGVSSMQLDRPERGFSFRASGPLDMRMDSTAVETARDLVNHSDEHDLGDWLRAYGEEPRARAIARAIVRARPLETTDQLAEVVARVVGRGRPGHHPATRTFQALRIAVNRELDALDRVLEDGWKWLRPDGRMGVLAYHSLEDRRVKVAFRRWGADCHCPPHVVQCICGWSARVRLLTPKGIQPDATEIAHNPRARSARLRVVERLPEVSA